MSHEDQTERERKPDDQDHQAGDRDQGRTGTKKRMIALDDNLVAAAAKAISQSRGSPTPTTRETISLAVRTYLPEVLERLRHAGLVHWPNSTRRPRKLDNASWEELADATEKVPMGQIELLRCCLTLMMREGGAAESTAEQDRE